MTEMMMLFNLFSQKNPHKRHERDPNPIGAELLYLKVMPFISNLRSFEEWYKWNF